MLRLAQATAALAPNAITVPINHNDHIRDRHRATNSALRYAERQVRRAKETLAQAAGGWPVTYKNNAVKDHPDNIRHAFAVFGITAHRNEFTNEDEIEGGSLETRDIHDVADILSSQFKRSLKFSASPAAIRREITALAHENRFHPVIDCLSALEWDGVRRICRSASRYAGIQIANRLLDASNIMIVCANHRPQMHYGGGEVEITDLRFEFEIDGTKVSIPRPRLG
ncbi:MAG: hypothetical protein ACWA49_13985 [Ruegeria sp.]